MKRWYNTLYYFYFGGEKTRDQLAKYFFKDWRGFGEDGLLLDDIILLQTNNSNVCLNLYDEKRYYPENNFRDWG